MSFEEKFLAKVDKSDSCWNWTGLISIYGYGVFYDGKRTIHAHRFSYELHKRKIPKGLVVDHLCRNRKCVNPDHLEAVTQRVNILRGESHQAKNARKTHCIRGHKLTKKRGNRSHQKRECIMCIRLYYREITKKKNLVTRRPPNALNCYWCRTLKTDRKNIKCSKGKRHYFGRQPYAYSLYGINLHKK